MLARSAPDLPHLTDRERQAIMQVLKRDEELRRRDQMRVMRLKAELQQLRRRGALRAGDAASEGPSASAWSGGGPGGLVGSGRACARCRAPLGRLVNRGAPCRACRLLVCRACRHHLDRSPDWVCSVCHKHMEIQAATGEWMNEYVRRPSRRRDNRVYVPPADVVKRSIRRSWTISNPSSRWSATRGSPELRAYNSLPRHQECCYTSLNHSPREKSPSYPRDEGSPCGSPRARQPSPAHKYSLPDDHDHETERPSTSSPHAPDLDEPAAASTATTSQAVELSPPAGAFRDRMTAPPALSARVRRQQYFSSRSDDDAEFQSRYLQNHVLRQHRQKSDDYVAGSAAEDKSSSPGSSPSVQESRLAAARDLRDVTSSSTSHSSREVSPLARRHQSFDVPDRPHARTVSLLQQHRHASVDRGEQSPGPASAPAASAARRYLLLGQEARHPLLAPPRRPLLQRDYVSSALEYSGNSDSGGEVVATPPPHARRCYAAPRDDTSSLSSHKADGSPVHASSGDDFDVEPISGTVFRKVTVKKRRQETRRVLDNGRFSRRSSSRVVESVRVTEVSSHYHHRHHNNNNHHGGHHSHHHHHHHHRHDPLLLAPDVDDYKLVFISSDSSSSKEDDDEEEEDEGADEDTESSSSAGCDWDYFEQGCCGERAVEEVTLCDQHCAPPPQPPPQPGARGGGGPSAGPSVAAAAAAASPWCAACGSATVLPVPVPIPVPVPFPVPFWSPAHQHHFMQDAALGVSGADVVAAAGASAAGGGVRIRIRNPAASSAPAAGPSRVVVGPWSCSWPAELISPLISGSTVVAVTSTGAVVQCPPAVDASTRALAAVPACEIFIRHERAEEPPVAAVAEIPDRPRRDRDPLSRVDKPDVGADNADGAVPREPVTVEPVDRHRAASESVADEETTRLTPTNDEAPLEPSTTSSSSDPPAEDTPATAPNTVRFHLADAETDEQVAVEEARQETDDTLERQRRALPSLPRERLHSSSSTSSSSSSTSSDACQDSEDEGAVTTQVAAGCYTVTAAGDSDADSDADSDSSTTSSGGEFSKVFVVNSGGDDDNDNDSEQSERDDLPDAPAESGASDAEDEEGGAGVVLLRHASFSGDEKTAEARQSALQQNKEEAVVSGGKKSSEPAVLSELACAANEEQAENCDDGIVLLKHVKNLEAENATHDASRPDDSKGKGEEDETEGDGIVLVKHVKKLEEESADVRARASDLNPAPDVVVSAKEEEEDGSDSEESVSDEVQMHHDTGDSSDSDSDSSTCTTSGCDSDLDSGDGGVVLLKHVEVLPEEDQKVVCVPVSGDVVDNESDVVIVESVVSDADSSAVVEGKPVVETEKSEERDERRDEDAKVEEVQSSDSDESECKAAAVGEDTGGEKNDAGLGGNISENRDDASENEGSDLVVLREVVEQVAEQGAVVVTPAAAVCSGSGEEPQQPEVTTEQTQDRQKPAGQGGDGDSNATKHDDLPVPGEVSEREVTEEESVREEVAKCVEEMAESITAEVEETVVGDEVIVEETGQLKTSASKEDAHAEESELREGIREADEDKLAVATGGGEPLADSWSGGVVLRRIRHLDDEGSDPALAGGRAENYAGRAGAEGSPRGSEMAPASADGAPRAATTHDSEEGVRNTCISLAALFAECDSASVAVGEDEVSGAESAGNEVAEVDERAVPATGAGTSGASAAAEAPVDSEGSAGESAAEMTSGDSAPAEHALVRDRGSEDLKTVVQDVGEASADRVEVRSGEDAATEEEGEVTVNSGASEIEQPVEPDVAAHLLSPEQQSDVCRRSRSASESEGTVKLEEEETESGEDSGDGEGGARAAPAPGAAAPEAAAAAAAAAVGRGSPTRADAGQHGGAPPERYTSLVMITQDAPQQSVSVVTSETTTLVPAGAAPAPGGGGDVVVRHTNWEEQAAAAAAAASGLAGYFTLTLEASPRSGSPSARRPLVTKTLPDPAPEEEASARQQEDVHVVTGADTLSAVVCLEEGLADDDSWVEEVGDRDEDEFATSTASEGEDADDSSCDESGAAVRASSYSDREEELRGYHRSAIDFTLHTIVEESCEESEVEHASRNGAGSGRKSRPTSASELEKYFFFRLGNGAPVNPGGAAGGGRELDSMSDTCSSIYSEGLESLGGGDDGAGGAGSPRDDADADELAALASSRLEKYFLTGFMGFMGPSGEGAGDSDGSGSVGSDSEGRPSPEQRRKRLVTRARRGHQLSVQQLASPTQQQQQQHDVTPELSCSEAPPFSATEDSSSTETEGLSGSLGAHDDTVTTFDRPDGQFDTVKRKKKRRSSGCPSPAVEEPPQQTSISTPPSTSLDSGIPATTTTNRESSEDEDGAKTPQPEFLLLPSDLSASRNKQHSRDSGFIGSCDDLLKEQRTSSDSSSAGGSDAPTQPPSTETASANETTSAQKEEPSLLQTPTADDSAQKGPVPAPAPSDEKPAAPPPPATSLTRKDSFNNWSSDEETNLMMSKMRAFFKTMVAAAGANSSGRASSGATSTSTPQASPGVRPRSKPPQLVYFENELTRLMKTVPGIRDDQVREIVEYLSSEDTWSDSYDSSDYTSSDLEAQHEHHHRHHQYHPYAYQPAAPPGSPAARSDLQEQISASCRQIINKFDTAGPGSGGDDAADRGERAPAGADDGKDNALVYQKLVASFSKMAGNEAGVAAAAPGGGAVAAGFGGPAGGAGGVPGLAGGGVASASSTPHSSPPLFAKVMQHIGSRLVALMHEVSGGEGVATSSPKPRLHHHGHHHGHHHHHHHHHHHRRLQQKPSSASTTTEEEEEEEDSSHTDTEQAGAPAAPLLQLPRSKSHDLLLEQQQHEARLRSASSGGHVSDVERSEHSDYERFSWRGSFESALMAADSRTKLSLLAGAGGGGGGGGCGALPESCKRRSAGDLLLASSRDQLAVDRVRSCGSIGGLEEEQVGWRRRSSVPDAGRSDNTSADDEDDDDDDDVGPDEGGEERARSTTLPRSLAPPGAGAAPATSNSLPRLPPSLAGMHKAHSVHHLLQPAAAAGHVKSARYRPPGFVSRPASTSASVSTGPPPKRAVSAPGLHQPQPAPRANAPARRRPQPPTSLLPSGEELAAGEEAASTSATASLQRPLSKSATPSPVVGGAASRKNSTSLSVAGDFAAAHDTDDNKLRPGLSPLGARSDSLASVYSGAGEGRYGTVAVRGEVEFGLQYNYKAGALEILVKQCRDLAPVDTKRNRSDPYVKVYLLPDKSKSGKRKTKVKKHTLNPVFDETLKFHITLHGLETRTLWLTVWHSDMFGRNDFLGEVMMSLENKVFDDPTPQWYPLQERTEPFDDLLSYKGDIIIGLKFVPPDVTVQKKGKRSRGSLQVLVKEAKNLTAVKANGTSDPFCKSYLLPDKGRSSKQKTPVLRRTCNPVWNYTFAYEDVSLQELSERSLELTVWDHDRLASNEFLGGLRFNLGTGKHYGKSVDWMDATGKEMTLWQSMLERPNFWVEGCLTLRPSLEHRSTNS